jgi:HTH-like domain
MVRYRRIWALFRRKGWKVNRKRVQHLWRPEGLEVPTKTRKKRHWGQVANDAELIRRLRAIEAVEHIGTPEARQLLEVLAKEAPNPRVVEAAGAALKRMVSRQ